MIEIVYRLAYYVGLIEIFYFINRRRQAVLTYHNVIPDDLFDDSLHLGVSCSESSFDAQMRLVKSRFAPTTEIGKPGTFIITFDDGYRNNLLNAVPILDRHKIHGIFFVPGSAAFESSALWIDRMLMWLAYVPAGKYTVDQMQLDIADAPTRRAGWRNIWSKLLADYACKDRILHGMEQAFPFARLPLDTRIVPLRFTLMSSADIAELKRGGHLVACHSYCHDVLARLSDRELEEDFSKCEGLIDSLYNARLYSYPFGGPLEASTREIDRCARSPFRAAFLNVSKGFGTHAIGRDAFPNSSDRFLLHAKLSGFQGFVRRVFHYCRRV